MSEVTPEFVYRVLDLFRNSRERFHLSWWTRGEATPVEFAVNCSDDFWWGCSDEEELTPDNIGILEQSFCDVKEIVGKMDVWHSCAAVMLFCARVRGMRPQGASYPRDERLYPLFDACGPEREVGLGNPYPPGERQQGVDAREEERDRKKYEELKARFAPAEEAHVPH